MKKRKERITLFFTLLTTLTLFVACDQKVDEKYAGSGQVDPVMFYTEIELRLREYENLLQKGDSIALGNMYMEHAEIIPSTVGRENIISVFGKMIRDSITGSSFKTTQLWGNNHLLVEEGKGTWSHANGRVVGSGRYLLVWKKDNGNWKILRDTWFPDKEDTMN